MSEPITFIFLIFFSLIKLFLYVEFLNKLFCCILKNTRTLGQKCQKKSDLQHFYHEIGQSFACCTMEHVDFRHVEKFQHFIFHFLYGQYDNHVVFHIGTFNTKNVTYTLHDFQSSGDFIFINFDLVLFCDFPNTKFSIKKMINISSLWSRSKRCSSQLCCFPPHILTCKSLIHLSRQKLKKNSYSTLCLYYYIKPNLKKISNIIFNYELRKIHLILYLVLC